MIHDRVLDRKRVLCTMRVTPVANASYHRWVKLTIIERATYMVLSGLWEKIKVHQRPFASIKRVLYSPTKHHIFVW